jgi:hypothetical protein
MGIDKMSKFGWKLVGYSRDGNLLGAWKNLRGAPPL